MPASLADLIFLAGIAHFGILIASAIVPFRLDWRTELASLSKLHRQMYWVYGGYVVLSIIAFGVISFVNSAELASGSRLGRCFCGYVAVFWGIRLALQGVFDAKPFLTSPVLKIGYHALTVVFVCLTIVYAWAAMRWA
jgi:hypothetical protein